MEQILTAIITSAVAIILAFSSLILNNIKNKQSKQEIKAIKDTISNANSNFFVSCPKCGNKIYLKTVEIKEEI